MTVNLGAFTCKQTVKNNGLRRLHFQREGYEQTEDVYFNIVTNEVFVAGRQYQIQITPIIGGR